jgi:prophage tail gpP-like protein
MAEDLHRGDELELRVEGRSFTGWEKVELSRSLEAASGSFSVQVSSPEGIPIRGGQEVAVLVAGHVVLRGFVDVVEARGGARESSFVIGGRDRTADLVDCSELTEPGEWFDLELVRLAELIAEPFGVEVRSLLEEELEPFPRFARQSGETAWSALERACRLRGVLAHSSGDGALVLTRPGRSLADTALILGRNVKQWATQENLRQRFSHYVVRGQSGGSDEFYADQAALVEATADDPEPGRFRPLLVLAEGALVFENARDRAQWEATVRAARAQTASVVVAGWRQRPGGRVWEINERVHVVLPPVGLDQVLLVNSLAFTRDREEGTLTEIGLTRADAYDPQPEVDPEEGFEFEHADEGD